MIPFSFFRKILLTLVPIILFYLLGRKEKGKNKKTLSDIDKSKIVEGEIVEKKKYSISVLEPPLG